MKTIGHVLRHLSEEIERNWLMPFDKVTIAGDATVRNTSAI